MDISFMLPDGTQYKPFTTVGEVKEFFHISDDDLPSQPVWVLMDSFLLNLYRYTVRPQEVSILNPQKEFVRDFFEQNVWWMVENSDTVDTLILEIRQLGSMWIPEINEVLCEDVIEWIIVNVTWKNQKLADYNMLDIDTRGWFSVEMLDKSKFTDYFVELVVEDTWRNHPNNPYVLIDSIEKKIQALYK